jgi:proline racemase
MAAMYAKGQIKKGESFRNKGLMGVVYKADCVKKLISMARKQLFQKLQAHQSSIRFD